MTFAVYSGVLKRLTLLMVLLLTTPLANAQDDRDSDSAVLMVAPPRDSASASVSAVPLVAPTPDSVSESVLPPNPYDDDDLEFGATSVVEAPLSAGYDQDPTAAASTLRPSEVSMTSLAESLRALPGARPLLSGGLGSRSTLSIRGASPDQTEVYLGGVPIGAEGTAVDLSLIPIELVSQLTLHRGSSTDELGTSSAGGVLELQLPKELGARVLASAGVGSFGRRRVSLFAAHPWESGQLIAGVSVDGARGDFDYAHDNNTPLNPNDDFEAVRQNADYERASAMLAISGEVGEGALSFVGFASEQVGGLTGSPIAEPRFTRRVNVSAGGALSLRYPLGASAQLDASLGVLYRRDRVSDPFAELSLRPRSDDTFAQPFAHTRLAFALTDALELRSFVRYQVASTTDRTVNTDLEAGARHSFRFGVTGRLHGRVLGLRSELRLTLGALASAGELRSRTTDELVSVDALAPNLRLALATEILPRLTLSASAGSGSRLPSLIELLGDRTFFVGDASLSPERSLFVDAGLTYRATAGVLKGLFELRGFYRNSSDLVRYVRTAQFRFVPMNLDEAETLGLELGADADLGPVSLRLSTTLLDNRDLATNRQLPLSPRLSVYAALAFHLGSIGPLDALSLRADLSHLSESFADPAALVRLRPRSVVGLGLRASTLDGRLGLRFVIEDLLDFRPADLLGFPLPGRRFFLNLTLRGG